MISAGDHERLPKRKKEGEEDQEVDLTQKPDDGKFKPQKVPANILAKLRKGIKSKSKFKMFNETEEEVTVVKPSKLEQLAKSPVKGNKDLTMLLNAARQSGSGIKFAGHNRPKPSSKRK